MTAFERHTFEIGMCPSPGRQKAREWRTPVAMSTSYDEETNRLTVTIYLLKQNRIKPDRILTMYLCRSGQVCGCYYSVDLGWQINSTLCSATLAWTWPSSAGCLLKSGSLVGDKTGIQFSEALSDDPGWPIYPVGNDNNPDCPGCGMSGASRESGVSYPVPGEVFSLSACIDEETCITLYGIQGCHAIASSLFQTVGFMGGEIHDVFDESSRVYEIWINGTLTGAPGCDMTRYAAGDWVALAKIGTEFPIEGPYDQRATVTDGNVPTVDIEDHVIIPYQFAGVA